MPSPYHHLYTPQIHLFIIVAISQPPPPPSIVTATHDNHHTITTHHQQGSFGYDKHRKECVHKKGACGSFASARVRFQGLRFVLTTPKGVRLGSCTDQGAFGLCKPNKGCVWLTTTTTTVRLAVTTTIENCPGVLGGDTCEGYIFINARVFLEGTPTMGTLLLRTSSDNLDGIAAVISKLDSLGRGMKKLKENVHAIQLGFGFYGGTHLDKECPLNEEVKGVEEVKYDEFGRPFPNNCGSKAIYRVGLPGWITVHLLA
ncbi:hypothetical protein Tco_0505912 [Tanacetum coccineum]